MKFLFFVIAIFLSTGTDYVLGFRSLKILGMSRELYKDRSAERVGGASHYCYRKCQKGITKVCHYNFTVLEYLSMSTACGNCPGKETDCYNEGCIVGGGHMRSVTVANLMLPGPSIQVCEGDRVIVHIDNILSTQVITIHWHGVWQEDTPFMDGTPYLTQCPILPHNSFTYNFTASPAGTHIWHSHVGYQEADGVHGSLIVRKANDTLQKYYDYDLAEHVIIIWHWYPMPTSDLMRRVSYGGQSKDAFAFLINGFSTQNLSNRAGKNSTFPRAIFHVKQGKRYRFRIVINTSIYCPVQVSIDNHRLLMVASDPGIFEPVEVDSFMFAAGERYDFVLNANQEPGNYFIRFRGLGSCETKNVKIYETAILRYDNFTETKPIPDAAYEESRRFGVLLNPMHLATDDYKDNSLIKVVDLNNTIAAPKELSRKPDHTIYLASSANKYDNIVISGGYPQINNLSFDYPPVTLLTQRDELTPDMYCTPSNDSAKHCIGDYCTCPMIYPVAKDSLVEIVFIDITTSVSVNHPMHLHGHNFYVVAEDAIGENVSVRDIMNWNENGLIRKKYKNPPAKDTTSVQSQGYTIVRFIANNPGYWFLHCHVSEHAEKGMGVVVKVGDHHEMVTPPPSFPRCGNFQLNSK